MTARDNLLGRAPANHLDAQRTMIVREFAT
jgi:hypothetical protein